MSRITFVSGRAVAVALLTAAMVVGCAGDKAYRKTASELYHDAEGEAKPDSALARAFRDCKVAAAKYNKVIREHPGSDYAILALMGIGDCHYEEERWPDAAAAYRRFVDRYKSHRDYQRVLFRLGEAYFQQHDDYDRDMGKLRSAGAYFAQYLQQFPQTAAADIAVERYQVIRNELAHHELYVAKQYIRNDHPAPAYERLMQLVELYADTVHAKTAKKLLDELRSEVEYEHAD